jgi:nicotinamide riboside transporter PnuC
MNHIDLLGWIGTACSILFYLYLSRKRVLPAYIIGFVGAMIWLSIGFMISMWSLVAKELVIMILIFMGYTSWKDSPYV